MDARTHFATKALTSNDTFIALQIQDPFPCDLVALYISLLKIEENVHFFWFYSLMCSGNVACIKKLRYGTELFTFYLKKIPSSKQ